MCKKFQTRKVFLTHPETRMDKGFPRDGAYWQSTLVRCKISIGNPVSLTSDCSHHHGQPDDKPDNGVRQAEATQRNPGHALNRSASRAASTPALQAIRPSVSVVSQ
jgi:hypothetical protein